MNLWNRSPLAPKRTHRELIREWIVDFVSTHPVTVFMLLMVLTGLLFVIACYSLIPPLESGVWYNHQLGGAGL